MVDDQKHKGLRKKLVDELKLRGIKDENVLMAILKVPRHLFFKYNSALLKFAYVDDGFPIGSGQTISRPHTVAYQSELLEIKKGDKVLEIGTGCGYQSAILCELGAKVFTIERQKELYFNTKSHLEEMNYKLRAFYGDGYKGLPTFAPFDKVIVTCGAPFIPESLLAQLKIGGILVIPIGEGKTQQMTVLKKIKENEFDKITLGEFRFVPMLTEKN